VSYALDIRRVRPHSLHGLGCGCAAPMAGLGEMTTPDFSIWTPARRRAWLNQIHTQVNAFTGDIREREVAIRAMANGPRFMSDWAAFKNAWTDFYRSELESSLIFSGTTERTQEFVNRYNALESRYTALTGATVTSAFTHAAEEMPETDLAAANRTLMTWTVIGIVGVAGLGYLLSQYAKVKTLSKLAFNRRRRNRSRR
jgi:hypothetical protein